MEFGMRRSPVFFIEDTCEFALKTQGWCSPDQLRGQRELRRRIVKSHGPAEPPPRMKAQRFWRSRSLWATRDRIRSDRQRNMDDLRLYTRMVLPVLTVAGCPVVRHIATDCFACRDLNWLRMGVPHEKSRLCDDKRRNSRMGSSRSMQCDLRRYRKTGSFASCEESRPTFGTILHR